MSEKVTRMYKNNIRLENPRQVQRLLARTINCLHAGDIGENRARVIGYLAGIMLKAFETVEIEERLTELEKIAGKGTGS